MICNEEDTDGRARVTTDEQRVLHVDLTDIMVLTMSACCYDQYL